MFVSNFMRIYRAVRTLHQFEDAENGGPAIDFRPAIDENFEHMKKKNLEPEARN